MIDEKFLASQKEKIEKTVKRLEAEILENKKKIELGSNPDDDAAEFEQFEERQALVKVAEKDLEELKNALKLIESGKYGVCALCGQEIELGRLKAYPAAIYCVTHARNK